MHADDWATQDPSKLIRYDEHERIAAETKAFLKSGKKITYVAKGVSGSPEFKSAVYTDNVIENAKKANKARGGKFTKRQKEALDSIVKAMDGQRTILYKTLRKILSHVVWSINTMVRALCKHGYFDFDGTTITKRAAA